MKKELISTKELLDIAKRCVTAVSIEECNGCLLNDKTECQTWLVKELAERLDVRLQRDMIAEHPELYIVLPCPMGTEIFMIVSQRSRVDLPYHHWIKRTKLTYSNLERVTAGWGDRVFLTRREAEDRLFSYFKIAED